MDRSGVVAVLACAFAVFSPSAQAQDSVLPPEDDIVVGETVVYRHTGPCEPALIATQCHFTRGTSQIDCLWWGLNSCLVCAGPPPSVPPCDRTTTLSSRR